MLSACGLCGDCQALQSRVMGRGEGTARQGWEQSRQALLAGCRGLPSPLRPGFCKALQGRPRPGGSVQAASLQMAAPPSSRLSPHPLSAAMCLCLQLHLLGLPSLPPRLCLSPLLSLSHSTSPGRRAWAFWQPQPGSLASSQCHSLGAVSPPRPMPLIVCINFTGPQCIHSR